MSCQSVVSKLRRKHRTNGVAGSNNEGCFDITRHAWNWWANLDVSEHNCAKYGKNDYMWAKIQTGTTYLREGLKCVDFYNK